jgi:hypothetical protein
VGTILRIRGLIIPEIPSICKRRKISLGVSREVDSKGEGPELGVAEIRAKITLLDS